MKENYTNINRHITHREMSVDNSPRTGILTLSCCFVAGCVGRPNWKIRPQGPERLQLVYVERIIISITWFGSGHAGLGERKMRQIVRLENMMVVASLFVMLLFAKLSAEDLNGQELLDKLRSYDSAFLNSQTISMEMEKPVDWTRPDERQKIKMALTTDNGSIGWEEEISYLSGPRYREGLTPQNYDKDGNLYVWNVTRKQGLIENDFQARRREMVLLIVSPTGNFSEQEAAPEVEFRQSSDRKKFIEYTSVIWSTGRGFADHLKKIIEAKKDENGLIHFTAHGNFSPNSDGLWEMVVDPKSGYLVRSASFTGNGHKSPIFICTTIGTKWFDNCSLAKEARFSSWDKSKITTTQTVQFKPEPDAKLFDKLRKTLRSELPKDTEVIDWRPNSRKALRFRVGKFPMKDSELLDVVADANPAIFDTNLAEPQQVITSLDTNGNDPRPPTSSPGSAKRAPRYVIFALVAVVIAVLTVGVFYARKTTKE